MLKLEEGTVLSSNLFLFMHLASYHGQFFSGRHFASASDLLALTVALARKKKFLRFWKSLKYVKEWPEDGGLSKF